MPAIDLVNTLDIEAKAALLYCPQMESMAQRIKEFIPDLVDLWPVTWKAFENGWPDVHVSDAESLTRRKAIFLASFDTPTDLFQQFAVIRALPFFTGDNVLISLPYFPTATKERMTRYGDIVTAKTLAALLSESIQKHARYEYLIYDIHSKGSLHNFGSSVRPLYRSALPLLARRIQAMENIAILYPDEGAWKRFEDERKFLSAFPRIRCSKDKMGGEKNIRIVEGDPKGKHVVAIDDLFNTCGTAIETVTKVYEAGASAVSFYATHGVCPNESWKKFLGDLCTHVWITDSVPKTAAAVQGIAPFEVLSLDREIAIEIASFILKKPRKKEEVEYGDKK